MKKKKEYCNLLEEIKSGSDWTFVSQRRCFPEMTEMNPEEMRRETLASYRVQRCIEQEAARRDVSRMIVQTDADRLLQLMAHRFNLTIVRTVGFALTKLLKRIFTEINVNREQIEGIKEICRQSPVVYMPTHKTYMDFLLLSYVCYAYELPLPAIAAGMDFMHSPLMGETLRRCGAFFIRRSFGEDRLYWAVFSEYVQMHLIRAVRPLEFFLEGRRSRAGKSLFPKYGLLQVLLEPYLRSQLYDINIVPISINYDKIMEEALYAYELLGFPKPKESASGLLKARSILRMNFGSVYITFGEPMSVRDYFGSRLQRSTHALEPDAMFSLSIVEKKAIRKFGHGIVAKQNENSVVTLWPLAASVCSELLAQSRSSIVNYSHFITQLGLLTELVQQLGFSIHLHHRTKLEELKYFLKMHANVVSVNEESGELFVGDWERTNGDMPGQIVAQALPRIVLANYANKMMHLFANVTYIAVVMLAKASPSIAQLYGHFKWLYKTMSYEFVCIDGDEQNAFDEAIRVLCAAEIVKVNKEKDEAVIGSELKLALLGRLLQPYLAAYTLLARVVLTRPEHHLSTLINQCQKQIIAFILNQSHAFHIRHSTLSHDLLNNAVQAMILVGGLEKTTTETVPFYKVKMNMATHFAQSMALYAQFDCSLAQNAKL